MAYNGGYGGGQDRPYDGSAGPSPHGYGQQDPAYGAPQQRGQHQDAYAYNGQNEGYGQDYGGYQQDPAYGRPPPQAQGGAPRGDNRGRPTPRGGRGGAPVNRRPIPDRGPPPGGEYPPQSRAGPPRGGYGSGPARGGVRHDPYQTHSDYGGKRPPLIRPQTILSSSPMQVLSSLPLVLLALLGRT